MYGGDGNDTLNGTLGNDNLAGGAGNDLINGGDAYDTSHYNGLYTDYKFSLSNGNFQVTDQVTTNGDDGTDTLLNIEKIKMIDGEYQILKGGVGNDNFTGSSDTVFIDGGAGIDAVDYSSYTGGVNINLGTGTVSYTSSTRTTLLNAIEQVTGSTGNDAIAGDAGNNLLFGGAGNDNLTGGAGNDLMNGGADYDNVYESGLYFNYKVALDNNGNWQLTDQNGTDGTDTLIDVEQVNFASGGVYSVLKGTAGNDAITVSSNWCLMSGGAGNDILTGYTGNDSLTGAGNGSNGISTIDTLTGGLGNDTFILGQQGQTFYDDGINNIFSFGTADYAQITDFTASDKIQLIGSAANYTLVNNINVGGLNLGLITIGGQTGIGLYRNNIGGATGSGVYSSTSAGSIGGNDDLIALIQGSAASSTLNLTNSANFSYV